MRALITGASGLLGSKIFERFGSDSEVAGWGFHHVRPGLMSVDVRDASAVHQAMATGPVDVCINCVANRDVAACEDSPDETRQLNVIGTRNVVDACRQLDVRLIHISTDFVFNRSPDEGAAEDDPTDPQQVYGRTKAEAERIVAELPTGLVVRLPLLYGDAPTVGDSQWATRAAARLVAGLPVDADNTEKKQPTLTDDVAELIHILVQRELTGTVHIAAQECATKWQWGQLLARLLGADPDLVRSADPLPVRPRRPTWSWLRNGRLDALGLQAPRGVSEGTPIFLHRLGSLPLTPPGLPE